MTTIEQRVKRIIKQTAKDLLETIEQDRRLITSLKKQRDAMLDECKDLIDFDSKLGGIEDECSSDGDGRFDTWQSGELEGIIKRMKQTINYKC